MNVHEFVDVAEQEPVGGFDGGVVVGGFQGGPLRALIMRAGVADMGDVAHAGQPVEHQVGAVAAIVGEGEYMGKAAGQVMGQPFQKEGGLVLDGQDQQGVHGARGSRQGIG